MLQPKAEVDSDDFEEVEVEGEENPKCPNCEFRVTWHPTHCCQKCCDVNDGDHGKKCDGEVYIYPIYDGCDMAEPAEEPAEQDEPQEEDPSERLAQDLITSLQESSVVYIGEWSDDEDCVITGEDSCAPWLKVKIEDQEDEAKKADADVTGGSQDASETMIPIVIQSYGRNSKNWKRNERRMGGVTDVETDRYHGDRDNAKKHRMLNELDDPIVNRCCGSNGRILLVTAMHPRTPAIFRHIKKLWRQRCKDKKMFGTKYYHGLRCRGGRHRGMAYAILIVNSMKYFGIPCEIEHLDCYDGANRPPCGCPDDCAILRDRRDMTEIEKGTLASMWHEDMQAAYALAIRIWDTVA